MKYLLPFLFAATFAVSGLVSTAAGQTGGVPPAGTGDIDNSDGRSADILAPRTKPQASTPKPSGKKEPLTASLFKDDKGKVPATAFAPADKIYLKWKDPTGAKGDKVRVAWYAEETKGFPKNKKLSENTQTLPGPDAFGTSVAPTVQGGLPAGKYRAEVYNNAKLEASAKFTVK